MKFLFGYIVGLAVGMFGTMIALFWRTNFLGGKQ